MLPAWCADADGNVVEIGPGPTAHRSSRSSTARSAASRVSWSWTRCATRHPAQPRGRGCRDGGESLPMLTALDKTIAALDVTARRFPDPDVGDRGGHRVLAVAAAELRVPRLRRVGARGPAGQRPCPCRGSGQRRARAGPAGPAGTSGRSCQRRPCTRRRRAPTARTSARCGAIPGRIPGLASRTPGRSPSALPPRLLVIGQTLAASTVHRRSRCTPS